MAWISAEKRYKYSKSINSTAIVVELIWDVRWKEALVVISIDDKLYEPKYNPFSFIASAKTFLKIVKDLEKVHSVEELNEFVGRLVSETLNVRRR